MQKLECVKVVLAAASNASQDDVETLIAIHKNIKATLHTIKAVYNPSEDDGSASRRTEATSPKDLEHRVAIDNLKLKALLRTLNL